MRGLSSDSAGGPPPAELSAILITRNEEANIAECLACLAFAHEVIVLDGGSTDATVRLAQEAGAKVVQASGWSGFGPQKNRALALATKPWVLSVDADERVTPELRDEVLALLRNPAPPADAWSVPRRSRYCGQFIRHGGWYPDRVVRLFRRGTAQFSDDLVHERLVTQGPVLPLRNDLLHYTYTDLESMLEKLNRYSSAGAATLGQGGGRSSLAQAILRGGWAFLRTYVLRAGFLDGRMGFVLAVSVAEGTYYKYLKRWLAQRAQGESPS
jgi:glycosyltransferase involved in cell wall biosynthesis